MQIVIAIPHAEELQSNGGAERLLLHPVCGVPLFVRIIATAMRAGADQALVIHRGGIAAELEKTLRASRILGALRELRFVEAPGFDPASATRWSDIAEYVADEFLWQPWNWVTNKQHLLGLRLTEERPEFWARPICLMKVTVLGTFKQDPQPSAVAQGSVVTSEGSIKAAERWLVAHSGKPLDGIYSKFNRWLCRPLVRALTHTGVTPNMVTLAGLLLAIVGAYSFSQGTYVTSVVGALLFFASGLLDEVDGMLARTRFSDSAFGTWFEGTVDNFTYLLLFAGITIGLYRQRGPQEVLIGELALVGSILAVAVISWQRKRSTRPDRPNEYLGKMYRLLENDRGNWLSRTVRQIEFLLKKGVFIHYVLLFTVLGLLPVLLRLAAFASNLTWILALYFSFRFFRRPRPDAGVAKLRAA
jgi:phosphatidylglycerophosphate synthase